MSLIDPQMELWLFSNTFNSYSTEEAIKNYATSDPERFVPLVRKVWQHGLDNNLIGDQYQSAKQILDSNPDNFYIHLNVTVENIPLFRNIFHSLYPKAGFDEYNRRLWY